MHTLPPPRSWLALWAILMIMTTTASAQHFGSARSTAIGASTATATDLSALDWNPAGLGELTNWDFSTSSVYPLAGADRPVSLQMIGVGRQFAGGHSVALRYSPGSSLEFLVPTTFIFNDSSTSFVTQFDKKIRYDELLSAGYAWKAQSHTLVGASLHYYEEQVTDTRYSIDTSSFIQTSTVDLVGSIWTLDVGLLWQPESRWRIGLTGKNIVRGIGSSLQGEAAPYELDIPRLLRFGVAYGGLTDLLLAFDGDTKKLFHAGTEWTASPTLDVRAGLYGSAVSGLDVDALSAGIGGKYKNVRLDLSYLAFLSQTNRRGTADLRTFQQSDLNGIEYNEFTSNRLLLTATVNVGTARESFAHIESVDLKGDVFPASRNIYAFVPIGTARVRNVTARPIEAKVSFYLDRLMDTPTESQPATIAPGATVDVPFYAVLNDEIRSNAKLKVRDADIYVHANPAEEFDDHYQSRLLVRGRNDWNGDVSLLKYFVSPNDPDVRRFSLSSLVPWKARLDTLPGMMQNFEKAKVVFDAFAREVQYVGDPKQSEDFVQYPSETLKLRGGDCDDMSVCYASLLGSMGISTAFVDVVPPDHPENSHIYLMFDTGLDPAFAQRISDNPKRYLLRKNDRSIESLWLPVETTAMAKGFAEAWEKGADEYFDAAEVQLGLVKGWVRVVDIETVN